MPDVEEKLAQSLTAETTKLIPYLPYLLQDLWELGSSSEDIKELMARHIQVSENTKVLDLACGKGAVSVRLAKAFGCRVKGIDMIPEFIAYAQEQAAEYGVEKICEFHIEDINRSVEKEKDYDIVILGAVGDVLGDWDETLSKLKATLGRKGYIFIDDAIRIDGSDVRYPSREQWAEIFHRAEVQLVAEKPGEDDELADMNSHNQACIIKRARELQQMYPEKAGIFAGYIRSQQAECDELERHLTGITWLLQVI